MGFLEFMGFLQETTFNSLSTKISKIDIIILATFIIVGCLFVLLSVIGLLQKIDKSMFDNVGEKIKQLARIIIWSTITLSVFASVFFITFEYI